jgi:hypothetical protein
LPPPPRWDPSHTHPSLRIPERATPNAQPAVSTASSATITQVIRDKKEAEQVAKKLFKDRPGPPKKVKDARKAVKEEAIKLTRGGGAPPIPKPPSGEPPSEEEARRRARRLMRRMSRKRKGKKHRKSKAFKKGMLWSGAHLIESALRGVLDATLAGSAVDAVASNLCPSVPPCTSLLFPNVPG